MRGATTIAAVLVAGGCNSLLGVHGFDPLVVDGGPDHGPCVPNQVTCASMANALQQCAADGMDNMVIETCPGPCVPEAGPTAAHCGYLAPRWTPDACDAAAPGDVFMPTSGTVTSDGALCTSLLPQASGPVICIVRYHRIVVASTVTLTITGKRPVAFVADTELTIAGTIVAAGRGKVSGPGGGETFSGTPSAVDAGGGGAGFASAGGKGGFVPPSCTACDGGPAIDPLARPFLSGGPRSPSGAAVEPHGGGGGGGLVLAACRGTVAIAAGGVLDLGGGGGEGQRDLNLGTGFTPSNGGGGGGGGGYVVLEALSGVTIAGAIYANGGAGGGGTTIDDGQGGTGKDGPAAVMAAAGGVGTGLGEAGGAGGFRDAAAKPGGSPSTGSGQPGGGGGSHGVANVLVPAGAKPMITSSEVSALLTTGVAGVR